ncbi:hypothetical protein JX266_000716 [Neoarthrinium moseri]|nr:hypothetical protein JX266_000716 [Neoarthrinium moseri]
MYVANEGSRRWETGRTGDHGTSTTIHNAQFDNPMSRQVLEGTARPEGNLAGCSSDLGLGCLQLEATLPTELADDVIEGLLGFDISTVGQVREFLAAARPGVTDTAWRLVTAHDVSRTAHLGQGVRIESFNSEHGDSLNHAA